jgi:outer membrane protein assembly factor BamB
LQPRNPLGGALLIADRGNDRMLLVNPGHGVLWRFPTRRDLRHGVHLNFNDDGFVANGGRAIVANEEEAHTIVSINVATHRRVHLFGVPGVRGGGAHLLDTPDDAYPLPNGEVVVADAYNCRVIWISAHRIVRQLGESGVCTHDPPRTFGAVNGDTPLRDGGLLVSEIPGHWIDELGPGGRLRWSVQAPVRYPSDPQMLRPGRVLVADYSDPGQVVVMDRLGRVLWRYGPASGPGALDHPSLALPLPNGNIAVNDDYRDRVVVIDPHTDRIVWQYGHTDVAARKHGFLDTPDGLDFVPLDAGGHPRWSAVHHPG